MWPMFFKILDDHDVIKYQKNDFETFPNMLETVEVM